MFLNTGLHLLLYTIFLNHSEGSRDYFHRARSRRKYAMEKGCLLKTINPGLILGVTSWLVSLYSGPPTIQCWSGSTWSPNENISRQQWPFWKPCVLIPVYCFSVFVPSIRITVSLDIISNPINFADIFFFSSHEPYNNKALPKRINTRKCRRTTKQETWTFFFQKKTKW